MSGNTATIVRGGLSPAAPTAPFTADAAAVSLYHLDSDCTDSGTSPVNGTNARTTPSFISAAGKFGTNGLAAGVYQAPGVLNFAAASGVSGGVLGTFTIEGNIKLNSNPGAAKVPFGRGGNNPFGWVGVNASGALIGKYGSNTMTSAVSLLDFAWHHVALVVKNGIGTLWCDEVPVVSGSAVGTADADSLGFTIGGVGSQTTLDWPGYIDEVRVSNTARYVLTPVFSAGAAKFGADGLASGVLQAPQAADSFLGSTVGAPLSPGTFEAWVKTTATSIRIAAGRSKSWYLGCNAAGLPICNYGANSITITGTTVVNDGAYHHVALVISSTGTGSLHVDGSRVGTSATVGTVTNDATQAAQIGGSAVGATFDWANDGSGVVDEVRISATPRYTGLTYTVPTAPFTADQYASAIWHLDGDGTDAATVALVAPPTIGTVTVASSGGTDTITYPAPVAGTNPVSGVALFAGDYSGSETLVATNTGTGAGTFTNPAPTSGLRFYYVRALDNATPTANQSAPSNEVTTGTAVQIAPNDAGIAYSPYTWDLTSSRAFTINAGAYCKTLLTGCYAATSIVAKFDVSGMNSTAPTQIAYRVDEGAWTTVTLTASTLTIPIPSDKTNWPAHLVEIVVKNTTQLVDRWHSPYVVAVKFTGFTMSPHGAAVSPQLGTLLGLFYGDSITEGIFTVSAGISDSTLGWAWNAARRLGCEFGIVGFGGTGASTAGQGSVPALTTTYNQLADGIARTFTSAPDFIWINEGTNDAGHGVDAATFQAALVTVLNALLAATPAKTVIFVQLPLNGAYGASPYQAAIAACTTPSRVQYVDTTGWWTTADASDGLHPLGYVNVASIAPRIVAAIRARFARGRRVIAGSNPAGDVPVSGLKI